MIAKPLIMLVDDDAAVLQALEAELSPRLEEIGRIEAFGDPRAALARARSVSREQRPVAVAVVDQQMPGMTGVELIEALRREAPLGAHLQAILLTGYGGLESAVAAKNACAVCAYLEKPWSAEELGVRCSDALARFLRAAQMEAFLTFELVADAERFLEAARLRYAVYRQAGYTRFLQENPEEVLVDSYDRRSAVFVLRLHDASGVAVIGTIRLITAQPPCSTAHVEAAVGRLSPPARKVWDARVETRFPLLELFADQEPVLRFVEELERAGGRITEVGRHAVDPRHRRGGTDLRQLQGIHAHFLRLGLNHMIAAVPFRHLRYYSMFGFHEMARVKHIEGFDDTTAVWASTVDFSAAAREELKPLFRRFDTGEQPVKPLCFCRSFAECLRAAYESRRFTGVDFMCPLRAAELLQPERDDD